MWTIYVLKSEKANKRYVGITQDLERRLAEHNSGKSKFTSAYIPWAVCYTEFANTTDEARKREKYLKSAAGRKYINKKLSAGSLPD